MMTDYKQRNKGSVVAQTAGALKSNQPALTLQEEHEAAERGIAEEAMKRMGGSSPKRVRKRGV
jgi:hypothetical protein